MTEQEAPASQLTVDEMLAREVERLRGTHGGDTKALYKAVCRTMFIDFGLRPTTNKLYSLVKKGSMSVPGQAMDEFYAELREKSRVRMERADLPSALLDSLGNLGSQIWEMALAHAGQAWEAERDELLKQIRLGVDTAEALRSEIKRLEADAEGLKSDVQAANEATELVQADLNEAEVEKARLAAQITVLDGRIRELETSVSREHAALQNARAEHQDELKRVQSEYNRDVSLLRDAEKRSLKEIDVARQTVVKLEARLAEVQSEMSSERASLMKQLGAHQANELALSRQVGLLEGRLRELEKPGAPEGDKKGTKASSQPPTADVPDSPARAADVTAAPHPARRKRVAAKKARRQ